MEPTQPRSNRTWSEGQLYRSGGWGYRSKQLEVGVSMLAQIPRTETLQQNVLSISVFKKKFLSYFSQCMYIDTWHYVLSCTNKTRGRKHPRQARLNQEDLWITSILIV